MRKNPVQDTKSVHPVRICASKFLSPVAAHSNVEELLNVEDVLSLVRVTIFLTISELCSEFFRNPPTDLFPVRKKVCR
jgi:hypothetical protein